MFNCLRNVFFFTEENQTYPYDAFRFHKHSKQRASNTRFGLHFKKFRPMAREIVEEQEEQHPLLRGLYKKKKYAITVIVPVTSAGTH